MKRFHLLCVLIATTISLWSSITLAQQNYPQKEGPPATRDETRPEPPPQAFEACKSKKLNEQIEITTPRGHKIKAQCIESAKGLFARPEHPPRHEQEREGSSQQRPPLKPPHQER